MSRSPLESAMAWWSRQDGLGGFQTAAEILFPGRQVGRSCHAPHREDRRKSFSVYLNEKGEWCFKDHGEGSQGQLVGFVMLAGMDQRSASKWLMEKAGMTPGQFRPSVSSLQGPRTSPDAGKIPAIPKEVGARWFEGVDFLETNPTHLQRIANWRGWPLSFGRCLLESSAISAPLYRGKRGIAFLVSAPDSIGGRIISRDIGFHLRLEPKTADEKASWFFCPNEKEHGQSTPALPFIIGGSWFDQAGLLVITEGQWDALTFSLAAGWLGEGCLWPPGVVVVGIRGAGGTNTFLQHYRPFWPAKVNCLLLPDGDAAGKRWTEGQDSFQDRLGGLCRKVVAVGCGEHKDFNDLYRASKIAPSQISEMLDRNGMGLKRRASR